MRPIRFRAWDKKHKVFRYDIDNFVDFGGSVWSVPDTTCLPYNNPNTEIERIEDDVELMQFTGFLDENGKEIYEGDILNYDSDSFVNGLKGIVEWVGSGLYVHKSIPVKEIVKREAEVIGNIYENPDLLKQKAH